MRLHSIIALLAISAILSSCSGNSSKKVKASDLGANIINTAEQVLDNKSETETTPALVKSVTISNEEDASIKTTFSFEYENGILSQASFMLDGEKYSNTVTYNEGNFIFADPYGRVDSFDPENKTIHSEMEEGNSFDINYESSNGLVTSMTYDNPDSYCDVSYNWTEDGNLSSIDYSYGEGFGRTLTYDSFIENQNNLNIDILDLLINKDITFVTIMNGTRPKYFPTKVNDAVDGEEDTSSITSFTFEYEFENGNPVKIRMGSGGEDHMEYYIVKVECL